jgi:hypothetical protein
MRYGGELRLLTTNGDAVMLGVRRVGDRVVLEVDGRTLEARYPTALQLIARLNEAAKDAAREKR